MEAPKPKKLAVFSTEVDGMTSREVKEYTEFVRICIDADTYLKLRAIDPDTYASNNLEDLVNWYLLCCPEMPDDFHEWRQCQLEVDRLQERSRAD